MQYFRYDQLPTDKNWFGLVAVTSLRGGVREFYDRVREQRNGGSNTLHALGRVYNGHTALMYKHKNNEPQLVGWDPDGFVKPFLYSIVGQQQRLEPVEGRWQNDIGMQNDRSCVCAVVEINNLTLNKVQELLNNLLLNPREWADNIQFRYAFAPETQQQNLNRQFNNFRNTQQYTLVGNCGHLAMHLFVSFLYDINQTNDAQTMTQFLDYPDLRTRDRLLNFSQGLLMRHIQNNIGMQGLVTQNRLNQIQPDDEVLPENYDPE